MSGHLSLGEFKREARNEHKPGSMEQLRGTIEANCSTVKQLVQVLDCKTIGPIVWLCKYSQTCQIKPPNEKRPTPRGDGLS